MFPNWSFREKGKEIAEKYDLATAKKKDSIGVCFIGERNNEFFIKTIYLLNSGKM